MYSSFEIVVHMTGEITKLRERTGAGVMDCKKALEEAGGDVEKAVAIIHERGFSKAEKKKDRATGAGLLHTYIHNGRVGVLLLIRCETDFVARGEDFKDLAHDIVMQIAAMDPQDIKALLAQNFVKEESITIEARIAKTIAKLGENIKIEKFCRYEI